MSNKKRIVGDFRINGKSLIMEVEQLKVAVKQLTQKTRVSDYAGVEDIGLTRAEATWTKIRKNLPFNSTVTITMSGGNHPLLDSPPTLTGGFASGTMVIMGNSGADHRMFGWFYSEAAVYVRSWNDAYPTSSALYDTGWLTYDVLGQSRQLTAAEAKYLGGKILNIKLPGNYFIAGSTINSSYTDSPFNAGSAAASNIEVRAAQNDRGLTFTLKTNNGLVSEWRNFVPYNGSPSGWRPVMTGGSTFNADIVCQHVTARQNNTYNIGGAQMVFSNAFLQNAPIVVSDRRMKNTIEDISDAVLDAWAKVDYRSWKLNDATDIKGDAARTHFGVIAQSVRDAFAEEGLDGCDYGILIHDTSDFGGEDILDSEGNPTGEKTPKGKNDKWMVRMEEMLVLEAALMRRSQKRLEEKLNKLMEG